MSDFTTVGHGVPEPDLSSRSQTELLAGRQIQAVTDALKDAGIPVILMKGHALARTAYPDPALRQSSDIDLLVQSYNIRVSGEILEKPGYICTAKTHDIPFGYHTRFIHSRTKG